MSDGMSGVPDVEAPSADAFEQSLPVDGPAEADLPVGVGVLPDDPEVPEPDAIEQHLPAPPYDEDDWR